MIDISEILYRIKTLPSIPRMIVFSLAGLLAAAIIFWSFANILFPPQPGHPAAYSHTTHTATVQANTLVSPLLFGTNIGLFNNNDQVLTSAPTRNLLEQIHTQIIRMPVRTNLSEATEIQAAHDIKQLGAVADVDLLGPTDPNALTDDIRIIRDMNGIFGNSVVYYEYGDEEDLIGIPADRYTASWNAVVPRLKQLARQAHFAGPVTYQYDQSYLTTFLKGAHPLPDEVSWHEYTCVAADTKDTCIARIDDWSTHIATARTIMTAAIGKALPIMITEWNYAPNATPTDGKSTDTGFMSTWTQKAFQTLMVNHVFASMQYSCTDTPTALISRNDRLTVQGAVFMAQAQRAGASNTTTPTATTALPPASTSITTNQSTPTVTTVQATATPVPPTSQPSPTPTPNCPKSAEIVGVANSYTTGLVQRIAISGSGYWNHCGYSNFLSNPSVTVTCKSCSWHASVGHYDSTRGLELFNQNYACDWANITATLGSTTEVFHYRVYIHPDGSTSTQP